MYHHPEGGNTGGERARRGMRKRARPAAREAQAGPAAAGNTAHPLVPGAGRTAHRLGARRATSHAGPASGRRAWKAAGAPVWPHHGPPRQSGACGPDSPSSLLAASGDLSCIVLSGIGWLAVRANSQSGNWARTSVSDLIRTKGDDGEKHRRRRQVKGAFCLVPLAALLPRSGDPIGGTFLGRQRWDTALFGLVATELYYTRRQRLGRRRRRRRRGVVASRRRSRLRADRQRAVRTENVPALVPAVTTDVFVAPFAGRRGGGRCLGWRIILGRWKLVGAAARWRRKNRGGSEAAASQFAAAFLLVVPRSERTLGAAWRRERDTVDERQHVGADVRLVGHARRIDVVDLLSHGGHSKHLPPHCSCKRSRSSKDLVHALHTVGVVTTQRVGVDGSVTAPPPT